MAYVSKKGDKWRAQVVKLGIRKTAVWDTKRQAQDWAAKLESEIVAGSYKHSPKGSTLRDSCDKYLKTVTPGKRNADDWERRRFEAFCGHFGDDKLMRLIDSRALGEWRDKRLETVSGSTVLREVNLYRNMFKLARREWKIIQDDPFDGVRLPKENAARVTIWRWQQIKRILRAGQARGGKTLEITQAFHIGLRTSLRLQEALAAPGGYSAARKTVTIPPSKTEPLPSVVPTTHAGRRVLARMPQFAVGPNEASVLFSDLCGQLGIEGLQFRDSRATALTLMARKMDILTLQKFSRHKDIRQLSIYYRETASEISNRF